MDFTTLTNVAVDGDCRLDNLTLESGLMRFILNGYISLLVPTCPSTIVFLVKNDRIKTYIKAQKLREITDGRLDIILEIGFSSKINFDSLIGNSPYLNCNYWFQDRLNSKNTSLTLLVQLQNTRDLVKVVKNHSSKDS